MVALPARLPDRYHFLMATLHQVTNLANRGWIHLTLARLAFDADYFPDHIHLCVLHLMDALRCARLAEHRELFDAARGFRDAIEPFAKDHPYMRDIDLVLSESWLAREADPLRIGPLSEVEDALGGFRLDGRVFSLMSVQARNVEPPRSLGTRRLG